MRRDDVEARFEGRPTEQSPLLTSPRSELDEERISDLEDHYIIAPEPSVYSYFLMMPPIEFLKERHHWNWVTVFAVFLVLLNFVMQISLLSIIGGYVLQEHEHQVHSILRMGDAPWYQLHSVLAPSHGDGKCKGSRSLCYPTAEGRISCAPPSISLLSDWDQLDTDGDGVWSRQEAEDPMYRELTRCEYNMDSLLVYEEMLLNLQEQGSLRGRLVPNVTKGLGIPKAYYDWFIGEPLMCIYGDADMCGNMFHMGVFDQLLEHPFNRGIKDFPSAYDYCLDLLKNRCPQILPYSYRGWATMSIEKCGKKSYEATEYKSPGGQSPTQTIMKVDYETRLSYENTKTYAFLVFLSVLLIVFFCTMLEEWKQIYRVSLFITQYNRLEHRLLQDTWKDPFTPRTFEGAVLHRTSLLIVTILRFALWVFLLYTGTVFLTSGTDYLGLIFDALSLTFIMQIDEALYSALLRPPMKDDHGAAPSFFIRRRRLPVSIMTAEFFMVLGVVIGAAAVTYCYRMDTLRPLQEALNCVCLVEGEKCQEAISFSPAFWAKYWGEIMPAAKAQIDALMEAAATLRAWGPVHPHTVGPVRWAGAPAP